MPQSDGCSAWRATAAPGSPPLRPAKSPNNGPYWQRAHTWLFRARG